jgi:hypothetical protein
MATDRTGLLRLVLKVDAAACAAMGLALTAGAGALDDRLGIPSSWLVALGITLVACAARLAWLAAASTIPPALAGVVVAGNTLWALASVAAVAIGWWPLTSAGIAVVVAQAVAVAALAELEYVGLRRLA